MKMKMRCTSALLAILIMCFMAFPAFASQTVDDAVAAEFYAHIENGVLSGQSSFDESKELKDYEKLVAVVESANNKIEKCVLTAIRSEKDDVDKLLAKVDKIVAYIMRKAEAAGYEVICEYTAYEIDGQTVLIDPLRVVNSR